MSDATQARCPECGHTLGLDPHVSGCGWAQEKTRRLTQIREIELHHPNITQLMWDRLQEFRAEYDERYPQEPEEPKPTTWFERVRRWFR